jgi:hypothetical protein
MDDFRVDDELCQLLTSPTGPLSGYELPPQVNYKMLDALMEYGITRAVHLFVMPDAQFSAYGAVDEKFLAAHISSSNFVYIAPDMLSLQMDSGVYVLAKLSLEGTLVSVSCARITQIYTMNGMWIYEISNRLPHMQIYPPLDTWQVNGQKLKPRDSMLYVEADHLEPRLCTSLHILDSDGIISPTSDIGVVPTRATLCNGRISLRNFKLLHKKTAQVTLLVSAERPDGSIISLLQVTMHAKNSFHGLPESIRAARARAPVQKTIQKKKQTSAPTIRQSTHELPLPLIPPLVATRNIRQECTQVEQELRDDASRVRQLLVVERPDHSMVGLVQVGKEQGEALGHVHQEEEGEREETRQNKEEEGEEEEEEKKPRDSLVKQHALLQKQHDLLQKQHDSLQKQHDSLQKQSKEREKALEQDKQKELQRERAHQEEEAKRKEIQQKEEEEEKKQRDSLTNKCASLQSERDSLQKQHDLLQKQHDSLQKAHDSLRKQLNLTHSRENVKPRDTTLTSISVPPGDNFKRIVAYLLAK